MTLDDHGFDVIVDAGRLSHSGLPTALVERADLTALVLRSDLRSIVSARVHLLALREHPRLQASARSLGLILVGGGQPYSAREIGKSLGVPVIAEIADDEDTARHLSDGAPRSSQVRHAPSSPDRCTPRPPSWARGSSARPSWSGDEHGRQPPSGSAD